MGIVQMQPEEKWAPRSFLQPRQRSRDTLAGLAVYESNVFLLKCLSRKGVIVKIETAGQPPTAVQNKRAHHRARGITLLFEDLGN